ncbi:MAG TPA: 50S ribosomal protein L5 [Flavobacteriales bacterium]|nr:50S ribosomal protein L5 [Flavobacteriales bacterium]
MTYIPTLKTKYKEEVVPALMEKFSYASPMQAPKLTKICLNQGVGRATADKKLVDHALVEMSIIAGQKAVPAISKKDISNFKLRKGVPIGARVVLRGERMYEFLERLIAVAIPRTRDFRGISLKGFDKFGNYSMGIKEQIVFPEIDIDKVKEITGMDITFVTTANTKEESLALLSELGLPFKKQ